jgi:hypothetical protein
VHKIQAMILEACAEGSGLPDLTMLSQVSITTPACSNLRCCTVLPRLRAPAVRIDARASSGTCCRDDSQS